jgi:hypothetical protein
MKRDRLEPEKYWPSMYDPGYKKDLERYVVQHCRLQSRAEFLKHVRSITKKMESLLDPWTYPPPEEAVECGIKVLQEFGMTLFLDRDPSLRGLKECIILLINRFQHYISRTPYDSTARKRLERLLVSGLVSRKQGKKRTWQPETMRREYYKILFRLYHVQHLLRQPGQLHSQKVKEAWRRFGVFVEVIRELWNLDENDNLKSRPVSLRQRARMLTARGFNVSEQTVSNILAH